MNRPLSIAFLLVATGFPACTSGSDGSSNDPLGPGTGGTSATGGASSGSGGASASNGGAMGSGGTSTGSGGASSGGASSSGGSGGGALGGAVGAGGSIAAGGAPGADGGSSLPAITLPPANAGLDYQLGGAYPPPSGVGIVSRDRTESPAAGLYNICYLNGFQIQPGEEGSWDADLLLRDQSGTPIIDPDWNEVLLDVSTPEKRTRIAAVVGGWIQQCGRDGFDAVEIDNLDTYSRSGGRISQNDAVALMALLSGVAHGAGLAIAQKNSTDLCARKTEMGTDFSVAEECSRYSECDQYIATYGEHVLMIEYRDADFTQGCTSYGAAYSIVKRDLNLVAKGNGAYVFDGC